MDFSPQPPPPAPPAAESDCTPIIGDSRAIAKGARYRISSRPDDSIGCIVRVNTSVRGHIQFYVRRERQPDIEDAQRHRTAYCAEPLDDSKCKSFKG